MAQTQASFWDNLPARLAIQLGTSVPRKKCKLEAILKCMPSLTPQSKCLDVGTAHGGFTYHYSKQGDWTYLEADKERLAISQKILKGQFVAESDLSNYLKTHSNFDLIALVDVAVYFSEPKEVLASVFKALNPGGYLLFVGGDESLHTKSWIYKLRAKTGIEKAVGRTNNPNHIEMEKLFEELGFQKVALKLFEGPFCEVFQTLLDLFVLRPHAESDQLYEKFNSSRLQLFLKFILTYPLRVVSLAVNAMDKVFPHLPRYAYTLILRKPE